MIKTSRGLQELRRRIYIKAKSEKHWRFWGLEEETEGFRLEAVE
jgi:hypothetical protein